MPRIKPSQQHSASNVNVKKLFRERLMDRFSPSDFVRVINPDNETYNWQYLASKDEDLQISNDGMHRYAVREDPEFWTINPGESEVIVGENAYVMIEGLFKKLVAKKTIQRDGEFKPGMPARNFNFSDALAQEQIIDQIYLGKVSPTFNFQEKAEAKNDAPTKETGATGPKGKTT